MKISHPSPAISEIQPLISVIIPCYNTSLYLAETLNSVLAQTYKHFEIIAVDDGSTDNTLVLLKEYELKDERIKVITQENTNVTIARINGIKHAQGEYLFFLDSDDKIAPSLFEQSTTILKYNSAISVVYCKSQHFGADNAITWSMPNPTIKNILRTHCLGNGVCIMVRKSDYDEVGGFDASLTYGEDWEFYISLFKNNKQFYQIHEVLHFYRKRNEKTSICDTVDEQKIARNFLKIYTKHLELYEEHGIYFHYLFNIFYKEIDCNLQNTHPSVHPEFNMMDENFLKNKKKHYNQPLRKWFYKTFKPKKYAVLCSKYNLNQK